MRSAVRAISPFERTMLKTVICGPDSWDLVALMTKIRKVCRFDQCQTPALDGAFLNSRQHQIVHVTAEPYVVRSCEHCYPASECAAIQSERGQNRRLDKAVRQAKGGAIRRSW
jgi:hypothetical protein